MSHVPFEPNIHKLKKTDVEWDKILLNAFEPSLDTQVQSAYHKYQSSCMP